ncbi:MAG: DUF503 domain-containing protein [Anaerolineae bacterium]
MMHIGVCTIELRLPDNHSLKGKRSVVKSISTRVSREFNVSIAEVDAQDIWQRAVLGVSCVSSSADYAHRQLERVVQWIEIHRPDVLLLAYSIEML